MAQNEIGKESLYNYKKSLDAVFRQIDDECSKKNAILLRKYADVLVKESHAYATQLCNMRRMLCLTRKMKKDWDGNGSSISSTIKTGIIIKNFMIINSGITFSDTLNSIIENNTLQASGIGLGNSPNTIIRNNTISLSDSCGIGTSGSDNTEILDNTISDSGTALCFDDNFEQGHIIKGNILRDNQFGINVFARMLVIEDNEIVNNSNTGIYIKDHSVEHQILSNTISNNDVGIDVNGNPWPTLINNLFSTNNVGLKIWDGIELSYNNNFVNNVVNVNSGSQNQFFLNDETGGGYWSDYSQSCNDVNNDNFCDDPYPFSGGSVKVIDNYVWTVQDGWLTIINTPADTTVNAVDMSGINHTYSVSATHDGSSMPVTCDIASGALFPIGVNEVLCTADNGIKSTFSVTVNPPPPVIHSNSPCDDGCTHEGNNPDLKIFASGYVEFPVDGVSTISSVWKDPAGIVVYDEILQVNEQGQFNNEFDNPMYIRDMRDSGTYTTMYTYDEVVLDYSWNYLTSVYTPEPDNGPFTLPCSMQENGDGVSSSSCHGFYTNSVARAEIGINYHSGILPIQNYQAVGFFIDGNGTQGQNITVTLDLINPNESKTLVFENTISGFVSEFQMQMLGGSLVTELEPEEPAEQVELDIVAPQVLVPENIVVNTDVMTGEIITFNPTAVDNVDELLTPTCTPQSGSLFPVGVTTVVCTATDAAGNANTNSFTVTIDYKEFAVPNWVKDVAGFWYADDIDDASFLQGIQYLIQNDVIVVPVTESESEGGGTVPAWVKNNAGWWSQGAITDADFVNGIQFLIKDGLIQIN